MFFFTLFSLIFAAQDLKGNELQEFLTENPSVHIMFYAPWCGHCKQFKPVFEEVSKVISKSGINTKLAKVDCTTEQESCQKHEIKGYPSIKYFKNGQHVEDYQLERTFEAYYDYVVDLSKPYLTLVQEVEDFHNLISDNQSVKLFGFFCSNEALFDQFKAQSESPFRKVMNFYYTTKSEVCAAGLQESSIVMFGSSFDPLSGSTVYSGEKELGDWIRDSYLGPCGLFSSVSEAFFTKQRLIAYFSVDYKNNKKYSEYYRKRMVKLMQLKDYSSQFMCGYSDIGQQVELLNLDKSERIAVFMFSEDGKKYKMQNDFSVESVSKFVEDYMAGNLKPYLKSDPIPSSNPVDGLHELVGLTFDDVVNQNKNVFILFYAPWCGHCKNVMPIYEKLAKQFENDDSVVIAKMDATKNEFPSNYEVTGFPTFYYSPINGKDNPIKYQGNRDLKSFLSFLDSNGEDSSEL